MYKLTISKTKKIILTGLILAVYIILDRALTLNMWILKINLSLVSVMLIAILIGPRYSVIVGAVGDLVGSLLFPFGQYFPGYTISVGLARVNVWINFI